MRKTSKVLCGPSKRWMTGEVEFWCEKHAYGKTMYPTAQIDAETLAVKRRGWKRLKNGSWQCPWCIGENSAYLRKLLGSKRAVRAEKLKLSEPLAA